MVAAGRDKCLMKQRISWGGLMEFIYSAYYTNSKETDYFEDENGDVHKLIVWYSEEGGFGLQINDKVSLASLKNIGEVYRTIKEYI